jgi:hypothetical protein
LKIVPLRDWWPPDELLSTLALAQHHGLPTRLLDWSRKAQIAAYFAASDALKRGKVDGDNLVVWALNTAALDYDLWNVWSSNDFPPVDIACSAGGVSGVTGSGTTAVHSMTTLLKSGGSKGGIGPQGLRRARGEATQRLDY